MSRCIIGILIGMMSITSTLTSFRGTAENPIGICIIMKRWSKNTATILTLTTVIRIDGSWAAIAIEGMSA